MAVLIVNTRIYRLEALSQTIFTNFSFAMNVFVAILFNA